MKKLIFIAAGLLAMALAACGPTYDVAEPLNNWTSNQRGGNVAENNQVEVKAGETLTAKGEWC